MYVFFEIVETPQYFSVYFASFSLSSFRLTSTVREGGQPCSARRRGLHLKTSLALHHISRRTSERLAMSTPI